MWICDSGSDSGHNDAVLSPSLTDVVRRRVFALLVDLGLVGLVAGFVARTQLETFEPEIDPVTGDPLYSAADLERIDELRGQFNRLMPWGGDTLNVIGQTGVILLGFVTALTALLVFVLLPANGGWSPGQRLFGLRTVDGSGDDVGLGTHALRTLVGVVDAFPWFLPGLLGWILARSDTQHRRLGDRVAKTLVIDSKEPITFVDPATLEAREQRRQRRKEAQSSVPSDGLDDSMVDLGNRLQSPDADLAVEDEIDLEGGTFEPSPYDTPETPGGLSPSEMPGTSPSFGDALDSAERANTQVPAVETPAPVADGDGVTVGDSTPPFAVDLGLTDDTPPAAAPRTRDRAPRPSHRTPPAHRIAGGAVDAAGGGADAAAVDYDSPVASTAPVWSPGATAPADADFSTEPSPMVEPDVAAAGSPTPDPDDVVWNDQWQAWLYWDPKAQRWLRHEPQRNVWIPIS